MVSLNPYLDQYGYWAVFGAIMMEGFAVPMPGQTLLTLASFLASRGELHFHFVLWGAWIAAIAGANIGYAIGRYGGRALVLRYGHYVFIHQRELEYAEAFFRRHGRLVILGARFLDGLRQLNGIIAGMLGMPWGQFLLYTSLGAAFWVSFWGVLSYQLGERAAHVGDALKRIEIGLLAGLAVVLLVLAILLLWRRYRRQMGRP